jgi:hypothetical protein
MIGAGFEEKTEVLTPWARGKWSPSGEGSPPSFLCLSQESSAPCLRRARLVLLAKRSFTARTRYGWIPGTRPRKTEERTAPYQELRRGRKVAAKASHPLPLQQRERTQNQHLSQRLNARIRCRAPPHHPLKIPAPKTHAILPSFRHGYTASRGSEAGPVPGLRKGRTSSHPGFARQFPSAG